MIDYNKKRLLESKGFKSKYPPREGYVVPLTDDRMFRMFCRDKSNKCFVAKLINLVTGIDYNLLIDRMVIVDSTIPEDNVVLHYNEQDVVVSIDNTTLNLEMSTNIYNNKRKNERTAFKYAGNQYKVGSSYKDEVFIFYQICIEDYDLFKNDYLINEVKMANVTSGNYEIETDEFKKFHINLKLINKLCYNDSEINRFFRFFILDKEEELEKLCKGDELLMEAFEHLRNMSHDSIPMSLLEEKELDEYCQRLAIMDAKNDGINEGKAIGINEGKAIGINEGKAIGINEGKVIGINERNIEIARNSLEQNIDINTISIITGLSIEEIESIK